MADARRGLSLIGQDYIETDQGRDGDVDGLFLRDRTIVAVFEVKARYNLTRRMLREVWHDQWLVTYAKLAKGAEIAHAFRVPLLGICYLVQEDVALVTTLTTGDGRLKRFPCRVTRTQATCNGGSIERLNAFVDLTHAREYGRDR